MANDPYRAFDGPANWGDGHLNRGYELSAHAGGDNWLPHLEVQPDTEPLTYHFIRSFDEVGVYTPAYAIPEYDDPDADFSEIIFSVPGDIPVPKWMVVAIERAGYGYDPVPNNERRQTGSDIIDPRQTELAIHG